MNAPQQEGNRILSIEELLAHAHQMEAEAAERYADLADQMEVHNNDEVAALFRKLSEIEGKHIAQVEAMGEGKEIPQLKPWEYQWDSEESPETPEVDTVHYLMTPYHAIGVAMRFEKQAVDFFDRIIRDSEDPALRELAEHLVEDEREHVRLLSEWQTRFPEPEAGWDEDPDPPNMQE